MARPSFEPSEMMGGGRASGVSDKPTRPKPSRDSEVAQAGNTQGGEVKPPALSKRADTMSMPQISFQVVAQVEYK